MAQRLTIIEFTSLDPAQIRQLAALTVTPRQEVLGGSFAETVDACVTDSGYSLRGWCFTIRDSVVGMVAFKRPPLSPGWVALCDMSMHGLKIDLRWQGRGLGKRAIRLATQAAARHWPDAENLVLGVDADNAPALAIYRGAGMDDSGPTDFGRGRLEHRMRMPIAR